MNCCVGCILNCMARGVEQQARDRECTYEHIFMHPNSKDLTELATYCDNGTIKPIIDRTFPLSEAVQALAHLESGRAKGKVVIQIR